MTASDPVPDEWRYPPVDLFLMMKWPLWSSMAQLSVLAPLYELGRTGADEPLRLVIALPELVSTIFHWLVATWMIRKCWLAPPVLAYRSMLVFSPVPQP